MCFNSFFLLPKKLFWILKSYFRRAFTNNISKRSFLARGVQILGLENVKINDFVTIGENTLITINDRRNSEIKLTIGNNVYVGRDNFFSVGKSLLISDYCIFGNKCSFICSDHIFDNPMIPYSQSGASADKTIKIGVNCWLGYNVSVVGDVSIGHGSIIGANSLVLHNIPPFSIAFGNPCVVRKRYDFEKKEWVQVQNNQNFNLLKFTKEDEYLSFLEKSFGRINIAHHSASSEFKDL